MFLKSLTIQEDDELIREITFHKGVNLIVDETPSSNRLDSGNNVGKTTVIRLIDYCLGGKGKNIYQDAEFSNSTNAEVESYLKENNVIITLILTEEIGNNNAREIEIKRNFLSRKQKLLEINGEGYAEKEFWSKLKELIFHSNSPKPSFRQIISKNIRDEKNRLSNAVKVLHATTTKEEYEALYLFWLGVDLDNAEKKQRLLAQKKAEEGLQKSLKKGKSFSQIQESIKIIQREIEELEIRKSSFNVNESYQSDLDKLNLVKAELNRIQSKIGGLELRKELILESKADLEKNQANVNTQLIKKLYQQAKALLPELQKSFDDTVTFHNQMIAEKIKYITKELPEVEVQLMKLKVEELPKLLIEEKELAEKLRKAGAIEELQIIINKLNRLYEDKGGLEEKQKIWEKSNSILNNIEEELKKIDKGISDKAALLKERVFEFNKSFSFISKKLYGESFVLGLDKNERAYELSITSISGNLGTGKKKGQIAAFDLAYIQFAEQIGVECLHFILHDQIETVHGNQILSLITEIASNINCQYIAPVLKDKLPLGIEVDAYKVLSLSQTDKLFKI